MAFRHPGIFGEFRSGLVGCPVGSQPKGWLFPWRPSVRSGIKTLGITLFLSLVGLSSPQRAQAQTAINICDRTPQVRTAILDKVAGISNCSDVTATHLAAIGTLNLSHNSLTSLKPGDFDGLTGVTFLALSSSRLTTLLAGVFDGLTALTTLSLGSNRLTTLPASVFDDLTALTTLNLATNHLTTLPAGIFDGLTALTTLTLFGNGLTTLPAGIFNELTALTTLTLDHYLTTLPAGIFDNLTMLTQLNLGYNNLTTLPAGIFDNLTMLTQLNLDYNNLTTLPAGIFDNLTAVEVMALEGNPGVPFGPVANAGSDQVVSSGAVVSLSGAATGLWGNNVAWQWMQVDGANSNTVITDGVTLTGATDATASFTAPFRAATLHFRLTITPAGFLPSHGTSRDADWVAITVVPPGVSITQSDGSTTVTETAAGRTDTYTMVLDTMPSASVEIAIESGDRRAVTVSPATLTFTPANWNTAQTVTVIGVDDRVDQPGNRSVTITHTSASGDINYNGINIPSVTATVMDDAPPAAPPVVSITGGGGIIEGQAATFTVTAVPAPPPGEPISVNVAISGNGDFAATGQSGSRSVIIDSSGTARFTVSTQDDAVQEDHGRITATVAGGKWLHTPHQQRFGVGQCGR